LSYLVEDGQLNTHRTCVASVFATNSPQFDNSEFRVYSSFNSKPTKLAL
jgi:hypothetical protein